MIATASQFKTVTVHNHDGTSYKTNVNAACSDEMIRRYFEGQTFNHGTDGDDLKRCTHVDIEAP